ncbi:MAG: S-adenosylmethionine:tRNA ribosyltransferase-isomerase [Fimbriimonadaceae bacterium]
MKHCENWGASLPPYIHSLLEDEERYQTTYSSIGGSAAAPTAGLHFTPGVFEQLSKKGVQFTKVSLDVGLDTFRPIMAETTEAHEMHGETCRVGAETVSAIQNCAGRVIAVGTTSVRTIESFSKGHRQLSEGEMSTHLFITPGYQWRTIDGMFTNFHMPRTTMLLMLAALCGKSALLSAYDQAVKNRYRFLSLGDSMLIL